MQKIFAGSISATHYQFHLFDGNLDISERLPAWNPENTRIGYISNGRAIYISTVADFNRHWIECYLSDTSPDLTDCERALAFNLIVTSDRVEVCTTYHDEIPLDIPPGHYIVYILAYSLGREEEQLEDDELEQRMDLERYKVVLTPGETKHEGVIKGNMYLP